MSGRIVLPALRALGVLALVLGMLPARGTAQLVQSGDPYPSYVGSEPPAPGSQQWLPLQLRVQFGMTAALGSVRHYVDGERIQTADRESTSGDNIIAFFDFRFAAMWMQSRWFGLAAFLGGTNWQSEYLDRAGHRRSSG